RGSRPTPSCAARPPGAKPRGRPTTPPTGATRGASSRSCRSGTRPSPRGVRDSRSGASTKPSSPSAHRRWARWATPSSLSPAPGRSGTADRHPGEQRADGGAHVTGGQLAVAGPGDLVEEQAVDEGREVGGTLAGVRDACGGEAIGHEGSDRSAGGHQGLPELGPAGRFQRQFVAGQLALPSGGQPAFDEGG